MLVFLVLGFVERARVFVVRHPVEPTTGADHGQEGPGQEQDVF